MKQRKHSLSIGILISTFVIVGCSKTPITSTENKIQEKVELVPNEDTDVNQEYIYGVWALDVKATFPKEIKKDTLLAGAAFYLIIDKEEKTITNQIGGDKTIYDLELKDNQIISLQNGEVISTGKIIKVNGYELVVETLDDETGKYVKYLFTRSN